MTGRFFALLFRRLQKIQRWLLRRFTSAGRLMLGAFFAASIVGLDTFHSMAYQAFTLIGALLLVSMASGFFFKPRFAAARVLPRFATVDENLAYRVSVENRSGRKQDGLTVMDYGNLTGYVPGGSLTGAVRQMLSGRRAFFFQTAPVPSMGPHEKVEVPLEILPRKRGPLELTGLSIARVDPLGLFRAIDRQAGAESVLVLPKRYPLPALKLPGNRRYQPGGVSLALSVGDSEEFVSVRDYRPGDPLRRIYWRGWAKAGRPVVKEYQDEYFVRHALILDTFTSEQGGRVFEEAVSVAASFASSLTSQESLLDLMFVGTEAFCFTSGRGLSQAERMLEILASVIPCADKPFGSLPPLVMERAPILSGCVCVLLAWDDARKDFIRSLQVLGIPLLCLVITEAAPQMEVPPEFAGVLKMLDVEKIGEGLAGL